MANIIVNGFNVGSELQQVILSSELGTFPSNQLGHLKSFKSQQEVSKVTCLPVAYNGLRFHRNIYHDWSGELVFTRFDGSMTRLINNIMRNFQATGKETYFSFYTSINNNDAGSVDKYLFQQAVLDTHNIGTFEGASEVETSIAFRCQSLLIT